MTCNIVMTPAGPLDVVLLEGWFLGFQPIPVERENQINSWSLREVNRLLFGYEPLYAYMDCWVVLALEDIATVPVTVYQWRLQAEVELRQKGRGAMTDEQVCVRRLCVT
jgi:D-glycerate 3-kinase